MTTTERPTYVAPRWIRTTEVAKLVREHLRTKWDGKGKGNPDGWKYSVRSSSYSGGSSVHVSVPKGFSDEALRNLSTELSAWGGVGFDGMTDSTYGKGHTLCPTHGVKLVHVGQHFGALERIEDPCCGSAEVVNMGASYVFVQRDWR